MNKLLNIRRLLMAALVVIIGSVGASSMHAPVEFRAESPLAIGDYVDWMRYSGEGVRPVEGSALLSVDPHLDEGSLSAQVRSTEESGPFLLAPGVALEGEISLVMREFLGPLRFMSGGIAEGLHLHGDSALLSAMFPEMRVELAAWGLLDLYHNGILLYEGLPAHVMLSELVRRGPERAYQIVRDGDGEVYRPDLEDKTGFVYSKDLELHILVEEEAAIALGVAAPPVALHLNLRVVAERALADSGGSGGPGGGDEEPVGGPKGNNGIGNGLDPQPPGNPPSNDEEGSGKPGKK